MQRQRNVLCRIMLMFVVAIVQGISNEVGADTDPFIKYTCTGSSVTGITITKEEVAHVKVFNHDNSYCIPDPQTEDGVLTCIQNFNKAIQGTGSGSGTLKGSGTGSGTSQGSGTGTGTLQGSGTGTGKGSTINAVTLIYGNETSIQLVGGINVKYYILSCDEESTNETVAIPEIGFKTPTPVSPTTLRLPVSETPTLSVYDHDSLEYYIGELITLEMKVHTSVASKYTLLPLSCSAYKSTRSTDDSYMFWQRCTETDNAIIPANANTWTKIGNSQSTLHIDMYAFKFVDSTTLVIKCFTTVCPTAQDAMCKMDCANRKRRSNPEESKNVTSATVSIALEVHDRRQFPENSSQGLSPVWYMYTIGFGMIYLMTWTKL